MTYIEQGKKDAFIMNVIKILIGITLLVVLLINYADGISGNDFWWHVKVGEWICENKIIPKKDIFSWYGIEQGFSWVAHEWLSEVIFFKIFETFGQRGIYFFSLIMAGGLVIAVVKLTEKNFEKNIYITLFFWGMFTVVTKLFFYGRPHIFSFYLMFFEMKILYDFYENPKRKTIFLLPVMGCLWCNLHGGSSSMAYILPIIFLVVSVCKIDCERLYAERLIPKEISVLAVVTILTIFFMMINPNGFQMILYPYVNMGDSLMQTVISEWDAPDAKEINQLILFYIPIVIMSIGVVYKQKKIRLIDITLMMFFLFLFFRSVRFIMLWYIAAAFYAFPYIPKKEMKNIGSKTEKYLAILAVCLVIIPLGVSVKKIIEVSKQDTCITTAMSEDVVTAVINDQPEKLFNDYNLGETLIYHDIKVFWDARADVYSEAGILKEGMKLMALVNMEETEHSSPVDVDAILKKYDFDTILIQKNRPLYVYMKSHSEKFEYVYENEEVAYYRVK